MAGLAVAAAAEVVLRVMAAGRDDLCRESVEVTAFRTSVMDVFAEP